MTASLGVVAIVSFAVALAGAALAQQCPLELTRAKSTIAAAQAALRTARTPGPEATAPRVMAGQREPARVPPGLAPGHAPRETEADEAPRGVDVVGAPPGAPDARTEPPTPPKIERARRLAEESERACKAGDMARSSEKAKAALAALQ